MQDEGIMLGLGQMTALHVAVLALLRSSGNKVEVEQWLSEYEHRIISGHSVFATVGGGPGIEAFREGFSSALAQMVKALADAQS